MKGLSLVFALLFCAQAYGQEFAPLQSYWYQRMHFTATNGPGQQYTYQEFSHSTLVKDTLAFGYSCQKIETITYVDSPSAVIHETSLHWYNQNKWYLVNEDSTLDLLYDFNLVPGDSIILRVDCFLEEGKDTVKVIETDSIVLNGRLRKRIIFEDFSFYSTNLSNRLEAPGMVWIEGIGDVVYGLSQNTMHYNLCTNLSLICFEEDETSVYGDCSLELEEEIKGPSNLMVYPNPGSKSVNIMLPEQGIFKLEIFDQQGRRMMEKSCSKSQGFSVDHWPAGHYTILLRKDGFVWRQQWIKIP